jgi:hypothetical protein
MSDQPFLVGFRKAPDKTGFVTSGPQGESGAAGAAGAPGAKGDKGDKGDAGTGIAVGLLSARPAAGNQGNAYLATDGSSPDSKLARDDGARWIAQPVVPNVLTDYGAGAADPTGAVDSTAAINAAIQYFALLSASAGRLGNKITVPPGDYKILGAIHLLGNVTLEGNGTGGLDATGPARFHMGPNAAIYLHSNATGPVYAPGSPEFQGIDLYYTRATFTTWAASTHFAVGACIRPVVNPGDHRIHWECVVAGNTGTDATVLNSAGNWPACPLTWAASTKLAGTAVRYATNGRADVAFQASGTPGGVSGTTGSTEPSWDFTLGHTTSDNGITWTAIVPPRTVTDGQSMWRARSQGIVMFCQGSVERTISFGAANYDLSVWGDITSIPFTNANEWHAHRVNAQACGGGITAHGGDSSAGLISRCSHLLIGYEDDETTPLPRTGGRTTSGSHGYWDDTFFGCHWSSCAIEACDGRGLYDPQNNGASLWSAPYCENCAPNRIPRGMGGGGIQTNGWDDPAGAGTFQRYDLGVNNFRIYVSAVTFPGNQWGKLGFQDLPGLFIMGDDAMSPNYWGWHRGYFGALPNSWTLALHPYANWPVAAIDATDATDGPCWREPRGCFYGVPGSDYFIARESAATIALHPEYWRRGKRNVGDRIEPTEGYVNPNSDGKDYVGKRCSVAGWEGTPWQANSSGWRTASVQNGPASVVAPTGGGGSGFVFQATIVAGNTGSGPTWDTTTGHTTIDGGVTWTCVGPVATYRYYGQLS